MAMGLFRWIGRVLPAGVLIACVSPTPDVLAAVIVTDSSQVGGYFGEYLPTDDPPPPPTIPSPDVSIDDQVYYMGRSTIDGITFSDAGCSSSSTSPAS